MKAIAGLLLTTMLTLSAGCAQKDWIDRTLVTVDVTGVWTGRAYIPHAVTGLIIDVRLDLEQEGPKVKGSIRPSGSIPWRQLDPSPTEGPIEGTVAGDTFEFKEATGHTAGRLTVSGDDMTGEITEKTTYSVVLRRAR
jgi:hypothetical protein